MREQAGVRFQRKFKKQPKSPGGKIREFLEPVIYWAKLGLACASVLGIFIGFIYCQSIGYIPLDSLSSLGSLAVALALLFGLMLLSLAVLWAFPTGVIWLAQGTAIWPHLSHHFLVTHPKDHTPFPPIKIGLCFLFALLMSLGFWGIISLSESIPNNGLAPNEWNNLRWFFIVAVAIMGCWYIFRQHPTVGRLGPMPQASFWQRVGQCLGRSLFVVLLGVASCGPLFGVLTLLTATGSIDINNEAKVFWIISGCMACLALSTAANLRIAVQSRSVKQGLPEHWKTQMSTVLFFMIPTLIFLGFFAYLPNQLMNLLNVRIPQAHITLTEEACQALQLAGVSQLEADKTTSPKVCLLKDVLVLSRVGEHWRIACGSAKDFERNSQAFNLDAKQIRYWRASAKPVSTTPAPYRNVCTQLPSHLWLDVVLSAVSALHKYTEPY